MFFSYFSWPYCTVCIVAVKCICLHATCSSDGVCDITFALCLSPYDKVSLSATPSSEITSDMGSQGLVSGPSSVITQRNLINPHSLATEELPNQYIKLSTQLAYPTGTLNSVRNRIHSLFLKVWSTFNTQLIVLVRNLGVILNISFPQSLLLSISKSHGFVS